MSRTMLLIALSMTVYVATCGRLGVLAPARLRRQLPIPTAPLPRAVCNFDLEDFLDDLKVANEDSNEEPLEWWDTEEDEIFFQRIHQQLKKLIAEIKQQKPLPELRKQEKNLGDLCEAVQAMRQLFYGRIARCLERGDEDEVSALINVQQRQTQKFAYAVWLVEQALICSRTAPLPKRFADKLSGTNLQIMRARCQKLLEKMATLPSEISDREDLIKDLKEYLTRDISAELKKEKTSELKGHQKLVSKLKSQLDELKQRHQIWERYLMDCSGQSGQSGMNAHRDC